MMTTNHLVSVAAMRQLAGIPPHRRIADILAGVDRLHTATRSWAALDPRTAAIDDVIIQADVVVAALRELRVEIAKAAA
jgi:hypothetical protein